MRGFRSGWRAQVCSSPWWALGIDVSVLVADSRPNFAWFPHSHVLSSTLLEYARGTFCAALSSQVLWPVNSSPLGFTGLGSIFCNQGVPVMFCMGSPPYAMWKTSRPGDSSIPRARLTWFSFVRGHCLSLFDIKISSRLPFHVIWLVVAKKKG